MITHICNAIFTLACLVFAYSDTTREPLAIKFAWIMVAMEAVWAIGDLLQHQLRQSNKRRIDVQQEVIELQNQQCEHLKTLLDAERLVQRVKP